MDKANGLNLTGDNGFISMAISIIVALIVVGTVLVPIADALANNSGGGGGSAPAPAPVVYTNTGQYYYTSELEETDELTAYYEIIGEGDAQTVSYYVGFNGQTIFSVSGIPYWNDDDTAPHDYDISFPLFKFSDPNNNNKEYLVVANGGYIVDESIEGTHHYSYAAGAFAIGGMGENDVYTQGWGIAPSPDDEYAVIPIGNMSSYGMEIIYSIAPTGDLVWADSPVLYADSVFDAYACAYNIGNSVSYFNGVYNLVFGYSGNIAGMSVLDGYNIEEYCEVDVRPTIEYDISTSSVTDEVTRLNSIGLDVEWDDGENVQTCAATVSKFIAPVHPASSTPDAPTVSGKNPDPTMMRLSSSVSPFSMTIEAAVDESQPFGDYYNCLESLSITTSNGTFNVPLSGYVSAATEIYNQIEALYQMAVDEEITFEEFEERSAALYTEFNGINAHVIVPLFASHDTIVTYDCFAGRASILSWNGGGSSSGELTSISFDGQVVEMIIDGDQFFLPYEGIWEGWMYHADAKGDLGAYYPEDIARGLYVPDNASIAPYYYAFTLDTFYHIYNGDDGERPWYNVAIIDDLRIDGEFVRTMTGNKMTQASWDITITHLRPGGNTVEDETDYATFVICPIGEDNGGSGSSSGGSTITGTLIKTVPVFVMIGLLLYTVQFLRPKAF